MSGWVAVVAVFAVLTVCGLGALALLGVARSPRELLRVSPVAPLAGAAWVGIVGATTATAGFGLGLAGLAIVTAATCLVGAIRLTRSAATEEKPPRHERRRVELALAGVALVVLAAVGAFALATYGIKPLVEYDGWAMWGMKAKAIAWVDADTAVLASDAYARLHLEYPLLLPALHALPIEAAERFSSNIVVLSCVAIGVAGLLAIWGLLRDRVRPALLLPFVAAIAAAPAFFAQLGSGYADVPVAVFVAAGLAAAARWLLEGRGAWLALATLFLAAAVLAKNEGLLFAAAALVSLFAVASGRRRAVALSAAVVAVAYAPWRVYTTAHDLAAPDYDLSSSFDLSYVSDRLYRAPDAVSGVLEKAVDPRQLGLLLVLGLAAALLAVLFGHRPLGLLAAGFAVLSLGGLSWIYVISPLELSSYLSSSGHRVVVSAVLGLAVLAPLMIEETVRRRSSSLNGT